jgi:GNAT superfamily N-acetyltransferase
MPNHETADEIFLSWIQGWAAARELAPPVAHADGFHIAVGAPRQASRYVFPRPSPALAALGRSITAPWVYLKTRATPDELRALLPARWRIEPLHWMMACDDRPFPGSRALPPGYTLRVDDDTARSALGHVDILAADGALAASGHVVLGERHAIYDRIGTEPAHQRRGLGRAVMQALQDVAHAHGRHAGLLVATDEGRALYETLGWRLHAPWAGAVIPGPEDAA